MSTAHAVLLVGATGAFGERLAEGLIRSGILVVGVARDITRLAALATRLGSLFKAEAMDRGQIDADYIGDLRRREPGLFAIADASGPFQTSDYRLPRAAIHSGLHYVDLADARAFVHDIAELHTEALAANVAVLAGASSTPALSHAVLDSLVVDTSKIISLEVSISPGNRAPRGLSVVQAILSTVGKPIRVFSRGQWVNEPGWGLGKTIRIGGIGPRRVALCETPDLDLLVDRYRPTADAIFRAGLELRLLHTGVTALSLPVRAGIARSLLPLARPLRAIAGLFKRFGTDRGGMRVDALVADADGKLERRIWTLTAGAGDGLYVPTLPALTALTMLARGEIAWRGAAPCVGVIPYELISRQFVHHNIRTETHKLPLQAPLFRRLLGVAYDALPVSIRKAHDVRGILHLEGFADATGPEKRLGKIVAWAFGLPGAGTRMPVRVEMRSEDDGSETWTRIYPGVAMRSNLRNADPCSLQIDEVFGPLSVRLQWQATERGLSLRTLRASFLGLPLPSFMVPRSDAMETTDDDGHFCFDVPIALPLIGRIVHYRGTLAIVEHSHAGTSNGTLQR